MKTALFTLLMFLVAGCSPQINVYSDHDPDYQVSEYRTFDWGKKTNIESDRNPLHYNELNDKRIKAAVAKELTTRGYSLTEQNPDLIIHYHIIIDDRSTLATEPYGYSYGPYWMTMGTSLYFYREGTLIVDIMDPKEKTLIWRAWATAALDIITPEETEKMIQRSVAKMMKHFPRAEKGNVDPLVLN